MRVAYYCQHVLGIGHVHRSLEICRALIDAGHETTIILGGPDVTINTPGLKILKLPGLKMNRDFSEMLACDGISDVTSIKEQRKDKLFDFFSSLKPDIFIVELYPFGRKQFRFEIDPLLTALQDGTLPSCHCFCSLRDILVEKKNQVKYESRVLTILNNFFQGLLIHSDSRLIPLNDTFTRKDAIRIPCYYTGFVTTPVSVTRGRKLRHDFGIQDNEKLIIASIGGGNVGFQLLLATVDSCLLSGADEIWKLLVFTGPYCPKDRVEQLKHLAAENISIHTFAPYFADLLSAADLSISMAGYNTCMNLLTSGIPALIYPFAQNREQRLRAESLTSEAEIKILSDQDLQPEKLNAIIKGQISRPRSRTNINLNGAATTAKIISTWPDR